MPNASPSFFLCTRFEPKEKGTAIFFLTLTTQVTPSPPPLTSLALLKDTLLLATHCCLECHHHRNASFPHPCFRVLFGMASCLIFGFFFFPFSVTLQQGHLTTHRLSNCHCHHGASLPSPLFSGSILVWIEKCFWLLFSFFFLLFGFF